MMSAVNCSVLSLCTAILKVDSFVVQCCCLPCCICSVVHCSVDAIEEPQSERTVPRCGRLVNHGRKHERNSVMKVMEVNRTQKLCLFASGDILANEMLSPYDKSFPSQYVLKGKLIPNLNDKTKYVTHYVNLKLYIRLEVCSDKRARKPSRKQR